ncbi:MAG: ATP-grasp domain-containing protein [Gammaproteobacteria bacterium]|nr:ATP-grasp domain-containing protein [Gammaproteobacteria bacterium]
MGAPDGRDAVAPIAERLLLLAPPGSYRTVAYLRAAERLGVEAVVASTGKHPLVGTAGGFNLELTDPEGALRTILGQARRGRGFAAVVATDDLTVDLAARVAGALGLPGNDPEAARLSRRKDLARRRLARAGLPVPEHRVVDLHRPLPPQADGFPFPCVIKPLALSGSRGVIRADDPGTLEMLRERVASICATSPNAAERGHALLEAYLPGEEVALEGLLDAGRLEVLALFDKPEPLTGPFFEESYYVTPSRHPVDLQARVAERVAEACAAYGLRHGPVHAELRLVDGEAWLIELAARTIGGDCARLLDLGAGPGLEERVIARALGRAVPASTRSDAGGVLMLPTPRAGILRRVEGVLDASRVPGVEAVEISVREGYELVPLPEGESYLGFVFARGPTPAEVEASLRAAHACLKVVTAPVLLSGAVARGAA